MNGSVYKSNPTAVAQIREKKMITISNIDGEILLKVYDNSGNLIHSDGGYGSISDAMVAAAYWLN